MSSSAICLGTAVPVQRDRKERTGSTHLHQGLLEVGGADTTGKGTARHTGG